MNVVPSSRVSLRIRVLSDPAQLEALVPAWDALAASALEPNPFYESWMLLPALRLLMEEKRWRVVVVEAADLSTPVQGRLLGFFPLELKRGIGGLPLPTLSLLHHRHCFLRVPLVRASLAADVLDAFFDFLREGFEGTNVLELDGITGDGPFWHAFLAHQLRHPTISFTSEAYTRAFFRRAKDSETFLSNISSRYLRDLRRRQRRLEEEGEVQVVSLIRGEEPAPWIENFVQLEGAGWKGNLGTAFGSSPKDRQFFEAISRAAHHRGRLSMTALKFNGRVIAMNCQLLTLPGSFAFKIAYDEAASRFAPGVLLELHAIQSLHSIDGLQWVDSCAAPDQGMTNRLWPDRRVLHHVRVASTPRMGGLLVALMPLARWMRRHAGLPLREPALPMLGHKGPSRPLTAEEYGELHG